jgi:hypothetical protein
LESLKAGRSGYEAGGGFTSLRQIAEKDYLLEQTI